MLRLLSATLDGIDIVPVEIEISILPGFPSFTLIGLPDSAIKESRDRIRAALKHLGISLPPKRITVNFAPAWIPKRGTHFDAAIALGLMNLIRGDTPEIFHSLMIFGELGLDGTLRYTREISALLFGASPNVRIIVPPGCQWHPEGLQLYEARNLQECYEGLFGNPPLHSVYCEEKEVFPPTIPEYYCSQYVHQAIIYAAAGRHHCLFEGSPGVGKTTAAHIVHGLLPNLTRDKAQEVGKIQILGGKQTYTSQVPLRTPHHSISTPALLGGGAGGHLGEITLAHHGVLMLDEIREFHPHALESLRESLESRIIQISRVGISRVYPANFQLLATSNPCHCGYLGDTLKSCECTPPQLQNYRNKLSGPLQDRIDMYVRIERPSNDEMILSQKELQEIVSGAHMRMLARNPGEKNNSDLSQEELDGLKCISGSFQKELSHYVRHQKYSRRVALKMLRLCLTIADCSAINGEIPLEILWEAATYRFPR